MYKKGSAARAQKLNHRSHVGDRPSLSPESHQMTGEKS